MNKVVRHREETALSKLYCCVCFSSSAKIRYAKERLAVLTQAKENDGLYNNLAHYSKKHNLEYLAPNMISYHIPLIGEEQKEVGIRTILIINK